jgi:hypothetical protein
MKFPKNYSFIALLSILSFGLFSFTTWKAIEDTPDFPTETLSVSEVRSNTLARNLLSCIEVLPKEGDLYIYSPLLSLMDFDISFGRRNFISLLGPLGDGFILPPDLNSADFDSDDIGDYLSSKSLRDLFMKPTVPQLSILSHSRYNYRINWARIYQQLGLLDSISSFTGLVFNPRIAIRTQRTITQIRNGLVAQKGYKFVSLPVPRGWQNGPLYYLVPDAYKQRGSSIDKNQLTVGSTSRLSRGRQSSSVKDCLIYTCSSSRGYQKPTISGSKLSCPGGCTLKKLDERETLHMKGKSLIVIPKYQ